MTKKTGILRPIIGKSRPVQEMLKLIQRVAGAKINVLIIGDSGTGKELVARMIHDLSPLSEKPFVPVNCGAIPETLIESEMFGHKRGSFTGAVSDKVGLFEAAHGGTLFLDEVGELSLPMQVKLLRAIQERSVKKVGGTEDIRVDVRIIAATNRNLESAVAKGTFREDLYYRLNVILIPTPALREREGDVRILAEHFLKKCSAKYPQPFDGFEPAAMEALEAYDWPGNVRELENVIERAVALQGGGKITFESLTPAIQDAAKSSPSFRRETSVHPVISLPYPDFSQGAIDLEQVVAQVEKVYLLAALEKTKGSSKDAALLLGLSLSDIRQKINKLGIEQ